LQWVDSTGATYVGFVHRVSNARHGFGFTAFSNGVVHRGEYRDNKRVGIGRQLYPRDNDAEEAEGEEAVFEGEWKDDKMHGSFRVECFDFVYEGEIKNNKKNGRGKWKASKHSRRAGEIYEGEWRDNKKHGKGKLLSRNGDLYDGEFNNDKKHGQGTMTYKNGRQQTGVWCLDSFMAEDDD
jgi:hypothetical protein